MTNLRRIRTTLPFISALALGPSCGGSSPAAPTQPLNLAGAWTGTWTFVTAGATVSDAASVTITQTGTSIGGLWTASNGPGGQLAFSAGTSISGTATISQVLLSGQVCTASTTLTGTASATSLQFTLGALASAGLCQWATNQQFSFTR